MAQKHGEQDLADEDLQGFVRDRDWCQVRETVLMLELAAGQIMAAMRDSDKSVDALANSFTGMAESMKAMADMVAQLPDLPEITENKAVLSQVSGRVGGMVNQAIVAFQFYDKLIQRLSHVVEGLAGLSGIVAVPERLSRPEEWLKLHERIRSRFSTLEERLMCDAVLTGLPVQAALDQYLSSLQQKSDDIELF